MKKYLLNIAAVTLIMAPLAFLAFTQNTQRKIEQETGKGSFANVTYRVRENPTKRNESEFLIGRMHVTYSNPTGPQPTPAMTALADKIDKQLPLATIK